MRIKSDKVVYQMAPDNKPVASCNPGDKLVFETMDCNSNQICTEDDLFETTDWDKVNPATGPVEIKGAQKGDILKVEIEKINLGDQGVMMTVPEMGFLANFIQKSETKIVPIENDRVIFNDKIKLPIKPMIGVIGIAPGSEAIPCGTPGSHGGNMDTKIITEGASLYLPVMVKGAMLAMGDLHAYMGDGEVVICGVEIAGEVTVSVDLIKHESITNPMVETDKAWYTIASSQTLDKATEVAKDDMFKFLKERLPLSTNEIAMLMSLVCDLQISQVVDPKKTVRMRLDKKALADYDLKI